MKYKPSVLVSAVLGIAIVGLYLLVVSLSPNGIGFESAVIAIIALVVFRLLRESEWIELQDQDKTLTYVRLFVLKKRVPFSSITRISLSGLYCDNPIGGKGDALVFRYEQSGRKGSIRLASALYGRRTLAKLLADIRKQDNKVTIDQEAFSYYWRRKN